jgi:YVTN family beta-propeller protein
MITRFDEPKLDVWRRTILKNAAGARACLAAVALVTCLCAGSEAQSGPRLVVLNKEDATLTTIDPASGKTLGTVATGEGPHEVTVSTDGKMAFASNYGSQTPGSSISIIDLASMKEVQRFDVSPLRRPHGVFFHDGKVYFTAETNRLIARFDPASKQMDWLLGTGQAGTHMVYVTADGSRMFTANIASDSLTVIERGSNPQAWNETVVQVGKGPEGFDVSPDRREVWAAHSRDGGVSIVDVASKKVSSTFDAGTKRSNRLKFTPDGKQVLISDLDAGDLVVIDVPSKKIVKRLPLGRQPEGILIPPDGDVAYVAVAGDNHVAVIDLKKLDVLRTIPTGRGPDGMAWVK